MSTVLINVANQRAQAAECARLIPGDVPPSHRMKKGPQAAEPFAVGKGLSGSTERPMKDSRKALNIFVPGPLQGRLGLRWLQSTTVDFVLVLFSWSILAAALSWLKQLQC